MIQDDDPRQSDVRPASALSDHATTLTAFFHISPKRNINKPESSTKMFGGADVAPIATTAAPTSIIGKPIAASIGFMNGNPKSNNFFHLL